MKYKLVVSDLDGTLLNEDTAVSKENLQAIKRMKELGVIFAPSSGRTLSEMPNGTADNPDIRYVIYSNGAVIYDKNTEKTVKMCIDGKTLCEIMNVLSEYDCHITIRRNGKCYVDAYEQTVEKYEYYDICKPHIGVIKDYGVYTEDFFSFCSNGEDAEVLSVFFKHDEERLMCKKRLADTGKLRIADAWSHNIEISSTDAGKGNALVKLAELVGADISETIAVGDSGNDIPMLEAAGLALAVKGASCGAKAASDEIICSNDEHILPYILSKYM